MADHRSDDVFANPLPNGSHWSNWNGYVQGYDGMFEARNQHTCALYENNSLYCWGRNNYGQLGLGTTSSYEDSPQFVDVGSGLTVESIGISGSGDQASGPKSHTCAVLSNGQLKCWGDNADGQLGLGNVSSAGVWEPTAVNLGAGRTAVDVATANAATCALLDDQSVKCWGRNTRGQLGLGNDSSNDVLTPQLVTFSGSSKPIKLAGALRSFCAIMDNGTMACWGSNDNGELGLGNTTSMVRSPTYLSIHTGRTVVSVDLGKYFTCVSYDNGSVACTGANNVWQLGLGNTTSSSTLQYVADMDVNAYRTDVAQKVGCAHLTNASLVCWGHDEWGLFGYSTNTYSQEFGFTANKYAVFPSGRTVASLSVGFTHACAVLDNGDLACWGNNNMAQLGLGNTSQQWIPVVVSNVSSIRKMAVHEMLVDPANNDFRPAWGSALQVRGAGAYDAGDADPWTAGISWTYTTPSAPVAGCMLDYADNYDADATLSDGSCLFSSYTPPSTLDLRLHLDPTNSSSYSGSGTNVADLSGFNNNGTVASVGPDWIPSRTRFAFDGSCSNNSDGWNSAGTYTCDEIEIEDSTTLRPGEPYEDLALKLNHVFSSTKSLKAPSTTAGYTLGAINTSFTVQVWLQPTDCETATDYQTFLHKEESYSFACKKGFFHYRLGNGTGWPDAWVNTSVNAVDDVWQHVAFTRSGSSNPVNMYLDGVLSFTASSSVDEIGEDNQEPLVVGTNPGDSSGAQRFYGILDDVRIYTSDRSSTIDDDMNVYPNVSDNNLNAYFDFNLERDGDTITSVPNMATGSGASSASLTVVSGSPEVVRTWDVSTVGSDTVLTFERTVLTAQGGWRVPTGVSSADVLIVGGGGGGGYNTGGGGGGGGVGFYNSTALTAGSSVVVVVGQGGQGSTTSGSSGANGTSSQLGTISVGGGGGGAGWASSGANGADAPTGSPAYDKNGSGGGASNTNGLGGTGATDGGDGANDAGAGGGGAGADGSGASSNSGGDGGNGLTSDITGSSVMYGSGAGGGSWNTYGNGGSGAGNGGTSTAATHGTTNRGGGGGGGGGNSKDGANGGSGVVIVRFASVDHNDWSVATWFNASSEDYGMIVSSLNNGGQAQTMSWFIRRETSSPYGLYAAIGDADSGDSKTTSPKISVDEDRWYHVVMVADMGDTLRLYLDGVNVANTSLSGVSNLRDSSNSVFIGSHNGGEYNQGFDGQVGSVMIFADALNASNINQLYTAGKGVYSNTTNLSYAQSSSTMLLGQTYSFPLTVTNGEVTTSYSLTGTLPSGMNFESSNGTIWGTPTATMTSTTYTVTANNSAGSYSTSISLTSQHVAPYDLIYSPENMTLTKGTAMTTNTPSVSGGTITSWEISPSLPSGLAFSTSTGAISGTPTVLQTIATTYTVWANNSGGSVNATVNITINDEAPDIAYSPDWFVLTNNTAMQAATPTNSGGAIPSAFFGYTGDAIATSIAVDSYGHKHVSYRDSSGLRYATDASGSWVTVTVDSVSVRISSIAIDSNGVLHISYFDDTNKDLKYAICSSGCTTASNWNKVSVDTTGLVGYYSSMAIDSNDALHISYFDDTNKDLKYATCSSGCTTASNWNIASIDTSGDVGYYTSIAIDSNDALHISYFDNTNTDLKYATCSSGCTTASNWNTVSVDSFGSSIFSKEVRTDLAIDSNGGVHISYFDNTNDDLKYATCSSGCTTASNWNNVSVDTTDDVVGYSASIGIDSNDVLHISYSDKTNNNLKYATCSSSCTTASNWNNETLDSSTALTGEYTSIAIDANDVSHISYFDDTSNKIRYLALDSSSNILGYSVSPDLPTGLRLDPIIGKISGTPTELSTNTTYTITVRNSGGVNTTTITILVNDQVPNALGYTPENMTLEKGTTMTTNTPSVSGGAVTSWEIDPSLPSGLSFGSTNGSIWGTPTILQTTTATYTIWANNSGGSESAQVNITINDQIASISYSTPVDISNNRLLATITPTTSGGAITSWEITPALPTGLSFGTTNGSIWGTPENVTSNATYTIYANNSGGSASATLTLNMNWTLTPSVDGAYITRNSSIGTDITWEWDYDPLEASNLTMYATWRNTCAIRNDGDVYCWGRNGNGQLGIGSSGSGTWKDSPTKTNNLGSDAVSLSMGEQHVCAVLDTGVLECWGR
ncbi:MAG: putative Ig domain-containing protein, partial [Candidatus Poseidoniaceae archaeon]